MRNPIRRLRGQIGLGTGRVQARFRQIKVTDLHGKVLFEGLPDIGATSGATGGMSARAPESHSRGSGCQSTSATRPQGEACGYRAA